MPGINDTIIDDIAKRLQENTSTLISDEALKGLVATALERVFFTPIQRNTGYGIKQEDSWFVTEVLKRLDPAVQSAVNEVVYARRKMMAQAIEERLIIDGPRFAAAILLDLVHKSSDSLEQHLKNWMFAREWEKR